MLLGVPYGTPIDMWSLGCLLMELHTGHPLFDGADEAEQIVRHYEVLGCPPYEMVHGNSKALQFFDCDTGRRAVRLRDKLTAQKVSSVQHELGEKFVPGDMRSEQFLDLVSRLLTYSPKLRIKPYEALSHPFFDILQQHSATSSSSATATTASPPSSVEPSPVAGPVTALLSLQPSVDISMSLNVMDVQPTTLPVPSPQPSLPSSIPSTADDMMVDDDRDKENDAPILSAASSDLRTHTRSFVHAPLPRSTSQDERPASQPPSTPSVALEAAAVAPFVPPILPVREQKCRSGERSSVNSSRNARAALVMSLRSRTKKPAPSPQPAVSIFNTFDALQSSPSQPSHEDVSSNDSMNDDNDSPQPQSADTETTQHAPPTSYPFSRIFTRSQHRHTESFDGADSQNELQHLVMTDDGGSDNSPQTASTAACVTRRSSGSLKGKRAAKSRQISRGSRKGGGGSKSASSSRPQTPVQSMVVELSERRKTRRSKPVAARADESEYHTPPPAAHPSYQQSPPTATGMQTRSHKAAALSSNTDAMHAADIAAMVDDTATLPQQPLIATRSQAGKLKKAKAHSSERKLPANPTASTHSTRRHPLPHAAAQPSASSAALRSSPRPSHFSNLPPASSNGAATVRRPVTRSTAAAGTPQPQQQQQHQPSLNQAATGGGAQMMDTVDSISQRTRSHITMR